MSGEYILPQVAREVEEAIRKALTSVQTVNGIAPDESGNVVISVVHVTDEQIASAVAAYIDEHGIPGGSRTDEVVLLAANWVATEYENKFAQVVAIDGVTENSQVDLTPSADQLVIFYEKDLALVAENEGGTVTVYAIGQKPTNDYTIQVTITETVQEEDDDE